MSFSISLCYHFLVHWLISKQPYISFPPTLPFVLVSNFLKQICLSTIFSSPSRNPVEMLTKLTYLTRLQPCYDDSPARSPALSHGCFVLPLWLPVVFCVSTCSQCHLVQLSLHTLVLVYKHS